MYSPLFVLLLLAAYICCLFLLARWAERRADAGRSVTDKPLVYALSLATYCTSWTFYGAVGQAVGSGLLFLATSLGPTLCAALWWVLLRKLVRIKASFHITSIADLLAARYGKSHRIAALATAVAFLGSVPYVALQLRSVTAAFSLVTGGESLLLGAIGPLVAALMVAYTILLGVRRMDPTDRHPGMVATITAEAVLKLVALTCVGLFAVYGLHGSLADLFTSLPPDRLAAIRDAFEKVMTDAEFRAEAQRANADIDPVHWRELTELTSRLYASSPDAIARIRAIMNANK